MEVKFSFESPSKYSRRSCLFLRHFSSQLFQQKLAYQRLSHFKHLCDFDRASALFQFHYISWLDTRIQCWEARESQSICDPVIREPVICRSSQCPSKSLISNLESALNKWLLWCRPNSEKWQRRLFVAKDGFLLYYTGSGSTVPVHFDTKPKVVYILLPPCLFSGCDEDTAFGTAGHCTSRWLQSREGRAGS
jgi:hypothetical protein